ncbi:hypothetical protein B0H19DRAFT_429849 [Mycena capillaripes]|nr:hypothetical protein B0H19DRAFT_429849 [Mycena capillaripes]
MSEQRGARQGKRRGMGVYSSSSAQDTHSHSSSYVLLVSFVPSFSYPPTFLPFSLLCPLSSLIHSRFRPHPRPLCTFPLPFPPLPFSYFSSFKSLPLGCYSLTRLPLRSLWPSSASTALAYLTRLLDEDGPYAPTDRDHLASAAPCTQNRGCDDHLSRRRHPPLVALRLNVPDIAKPLIDSGGRYRTPALVGGSNSRDYLLQRRVFPPRGQAAPHSRLSHTRKCVGAYSFTGWRYRVTRCRPSLKLIQIQLRQSLHFHFAAVSPAPAGTKHSSSKPISIKSNRILLVDAPIWL